MQFMQHEHWQHFRIFLLLRRVRRFGLLITSADRTLQSEDNVSESARMARELALTPTGMPSC